MTERRPPSLGKLLSRAFALAAPDSRVQRAIVSRALEAAEPGFDPSDPDRLRRFVSGPLLSAAQHVVGKERARRLISMVLSDLDDDEMEQSSAVKEIHSEEPPVRTALVVTKRRAAQRAFSRLLSAEGFSIRFVRDAESALAECRAISPELVLADVDALDVDGPQLIRTLSEAVEETPAIVLVKRGTTLVEGSTVVAKPLDRDRLMDAIADALQERQRALEAALRAQCHSLDALIREAVDGVASPSVRDALLRDALSAAKVSQLPATARQLTALVDGPLRSAISERLGDEVAAQVIAQLGPQLERARIDACSGVRRRMSGQHRADSGDVPRAAGSGPGRR